MVNCCVFGCTNQAKKGGVSFHMLEFQYFVTEYW